MSELVVDGGGVNATITVSYQSEPLMGFLVPVAMHESYDRQRRARGGHRHRTAGSGAPVSAPATVMVLPGATPRCHTGTRRPWRGAITCTSTRDTPAGTPTCTGMSFCAS